MTLYTNKNPLFTARTKPTGEVMDHFYSGPVFFRLLTSSEWNNLAKTTPSMWYQEFTENNYDVVNIDAGQHRTLVKHVPEFLAKILQQDSFFPSIMPLSEFFANPPLKFYGLHLRDLEIRHADVEHPTSGPVRVTYNMLPAVELLVGTEKIVAIANEVKLATNPPLT